MGEQRFGDSFKWECWQIRDNVKKYASKLWQDWNHNMYGFGDGPAGEFIPYDNLDLAKHRVEVGFKFLEDERFRKLLNTTVVVRNLFGCVKKYITKAERQLSSGTQTSLFETMDDTEKRAEIKERELKEDLKYLKEVRDMIKSPRSYFQNCYRS